MECPYCKQEMKRGYLYGDGRRSVRWQEEGKKLMITDKMAGIGLVAKATWGTFKIPGEYCKNCKKLMIETEIAE